MRFFNAIENNIKHGRTWLYLNDENNKFCFEWRLNFNPFNFCLTLDGDEGDYTFCFWFIWVFYISTNIFKYYPKEWNSQTNNKQGGYLATGKRTIGISHYSTSIFLYLWHDGETSWYPKKDYKLFYKYINLTNIFCGDFKYHTLDERETTEYIDLPEKRYNINVKHSISHKKWKRFYMRMFNKKERIFVIKSDIKYPKRKWTQFDKDNNITPEELETTLYYDFLVTLKMEETIQDAIKRYKDLIILKRSVESENWVPSEYRKFYEREKKFKRVVNYI